LHISWRSRRDVRNNDIGITCNWRNMCYSCSYRHNKGGLEMFGLVIAGVAALVVLCIYGACEMDDEE